jgi:hypothetical protein
MGVMGKGSGSIAKMGEWHGGGEVSLKGRKWVNNANKN